MSQSIEDGLVEREETYGMTPQFRRFLEAVGSVERAMVAWDIAREDLERLEAEKRLCVEENAKLRALLNNTRAKSRPRGLDLLREEADAALPHFTSTWETLRVVAERAGVKSAAWLASRARNLQERGLVESKWVGAERTQFKLWRALSSLGGTRDHA